MFGRVVFGDIVAEVFCPRVPVYCQMFVVDLVGDPEVSHCHSGGALAFHSVVGDSGGSAVVHVDGRGWLRVSHFDKCLSNKDTVFCVVVDCTNFGFCRQ